MFTEAECVAKVADMVRLADQTTAPRWRAEYLVLAAGWRRAGAMAAWQDEPRSFIAPID